MAIRRPFNLTKWIENNRSLLQPPVGNKNLYVESDDYIVMIVGGPNARKDYHYNETEELFFQIEGDIEVVIQEKGQVMIIPIKEGEIYLHPAKIPHSPIRPKDTVGLVIERKRTTEHEDGLLWFCDHCNTKLHETYFHLTNIEKDFLSRFKEFFASEQLRTCRQCGKVMEVDPRFCEKNAM